MTAVEPRETGEKFGGQLGSRVFVEAQGVGQHGSRTLGHDKPILRLDRPPNEEDFLSR